MAKFFPVDNDTGDVKCIPVRRATSWKEHVVEKVILIKPHLKPEFVANPHKAIDAKIVKGKGKAKGSIHLLKVISIVKSPVPPD